MRQRGVTEASGRDGDESVCLSVCLTDPPPPITRINHQNMTQVSSSLSSTQSRKQFVASSKELCLTVNVSSRTWTPPCRCSTSTESASSLWERYVSTCRVNPDSQYSKCCANDGVKGGVCVMGGGATVKSSHPYTELTPS